MRAGPSGGGIGATVRASVCWAFNEGSCAYGAACKFQHMCDRCSGRHSASTCSKGASAQKWGTGWMTRDPETETLSAYLAPGRVWQIVTKPCMTIMHNGIIKELVAYSTIILLKYLNQSQCT